MLIGIDASRAATGQRTGTENYSLHLIRELLALPSGHHFRLYFNQAPAPDLFAGRAQRRVIPFPRLWTHLRLSWEMLAHPPDVLFVPSHVLPLAHPPRTVVTVHDLGYHHYPEAHTLFQNAYLRWSTRFNARNASLILADSEATRRDLIHYYRVPSSKIIVAYPGCDESLSPVTDPVRLAEVRSRYGLPESYLLYVGTLHPRKNLVRLIQACALLLTLDLEHDASSTVAAPAAALDLVLAGQKGWLYDDILDQVHKLGLQGRIVLPGYVPREDLAALLSGALAFVFPSLYEGFGLPVLEAMACGTPVVCSNASSLPEVAGDAALLVDPMDVDALAAAMARVVTDGGLRRELVERGFRQSQQFSWRRCALDTLRALEQTGGLDPHR